jgi:hypothetical protein
MAAGELVHALLAVSREFGPRAAHAKAELLGDLEGAVAIAPRDLIALQECCNFLRAYPDNAQQVARRVRRVAGSIRARVEALPPALRRRALWNSGLPGAENGYSFDWGVVEQLVRAVPGSVELDWDAMEDHDAILDSLRQLAPVAESDGLDDDRISLQEWFAAARPRGCRTDLETWLGLVAQCDAAPNIAANLYERGDPLIHYRLDQPGTGSCELELDAGGAKAVYQREPVDRSKFPLEPLIREPLTEGLRPLPKRRAEQLIRLSMLALCARNLQIYPLIYPNPQDVRLVPCARGLQVVLIGTRPPFRAQLECLYYFGVFKNGVPVAYGPAGVFGGACEMGINLFPEFRGAEIRLIYAQVMRVLRHVLGAEYYFLQPYGMGVDNPDAIASGAFWFYRKMGFKAENPDIEALAQEEEQRMREYPGYRSDRRMLHRLKHTRAYFDLSNGQCAPFDFGLLSRIQTAHIASRFRGDRAAAMAKSGDAVAKTLRAGGRAKWPAGERAAFDALALPVSLIPGLAEWSAAEKRAAVAAMRAKGAASEATAAKRWAKHRALVAGLRAVTAVE